MWLALLSCRRDDPEPPATAPQLPVVLDDGALVFTHHGRDRVRLPLSALRLGVVRGYEADRSYDPFWSNSLADDGVDWFSPEVSGELPTLELTYGDGLTATLTVTPAAEGRVTATLVPQGDHGGQVVAYVDVPLDTDADEGFYGLGSALDHLNRRGSVRAVQLEVDPTTEVFDNEMHVHLPFFVGTTGWGFLARDDHPATVDFATQAPDRVTYRVGLGDDAAQGLVFDVYTADHPLDLTARYWQATGTHRLPARWALGPWHWRDENVDQAEVESDLHTLRDLDVATTGLWVDRPYASGVNTFDFEAGRFPDPERMIGLAHDLGFRMALWHTPYTAPGEADDLLAHAEENGFFPPVHPLAFIDWGTPLDFSNPDARDWWQSLIGRYSDLGIEGYKLDYAEEVLVGALGGRLAWEFDDGTDELTKHADYQRLYHQTYAETLPADGGFLLCRTATWGDQVNGPIIWPGDLDATMTRWAEPAVNRQGEEYVSVGGLPASVIDGLSLGVSGFPFYGSDTGGYRNGPPDEETYVRWVEATSVASVMQVGNGDNDVAWEPTAENGFGPETVDALRTYARLHLRLWPYLWTLADEIGRGEGRPIMRPLGLAHPELGVHPDDQYLLGPWLLAAPVVDRGARSKDVVFPEGRWLHWFDGTVHEGGTERVDAGLYELPLFLAEGAIVPLLRDTIDTLAPVRGDDVDSYATDPGVLGVRVFPGGKTSFTLFDGTTITQEGTRLQFTGGDEFTQGARFELVGTDEPRDVLVDGASGDWSWSPEVGGTVVVTVGGDAVLELR
jgi:alpha-D-xyloside xylohydrolase